MIGDHEQVNSRKRYREIAGVLSHHGFEWLWSDWGIGRILGKAQRHRRESSETIRSQQEMLRLTLEELGATFVKVGQMLSTRPDLVPQEYISELSKLQDHAAEVPFDDIAAIIQREFGRPLDEVFRSFNREPKAAASIAQVHQALLPDGTPVVVKIRRPGIEVQVEEDLAILGKLARWVTQNTEFGKTLDLVGMVEEFAHTLRNELDFTREGHNAERIAREFSNDPCLHVPQVYWEFSTGSVLAMEDVCGIKIDDLDALDAAGINRKELAERCAHIAFVQVLEHGFFHADPHPGNFFVLPDGVIALIDYGMVGRIRDRLRESILRLALALSRHDTDRLIDELLAMGVTRDRVNRRMLGSDLDHLFLQYDGVPLGDLSAAQIFREVTTTAQKHGLVLPSDLILLVRVIAMDEGLGAKLDPSFNMIEFAKPYFKRFWRKHYSLRAMTRRARDGAIDLAEMSLDLPQRMNRIVGLIERSELRVTTRVELPDEMIKNIQQAVNRIAMSILVAGLLIGFSVLMFVYRSTGSEGFVSLLLKVLLGLGVAASSWLLYAFWKSRK